MNNGLAEGPWGAAEFITPDQMTVRNHQVDLWQRMSTDLSAAGLFFTREERDIRLAVLYVEGVRPRGRYPWEDAPAMVPENWRLGQPGQEEAEDQARRTMAAWCWPTSTGAPELIDTVLIAQIKDPVERAAELRRRVAGVAKHLQSAYARHGMDLRQTLLPWMELRGDPYWFARLLDREVPIVAQDLLEASAVAGLSFSRGPLWGEPFQERPSRTSGRWEFDPDIRTHYARVLQVVAQIAPNVRQELTGILEGRRPDWQNPQLLHRRHVAPVVPPAPGNKYRPLFDYLDDIKYPGQEEVRLTLLEIDELVGAQPDAGRGRRSEGLPASAKYPSWWANPGGRGPSKEAAKHRAAAAPGGRRSHAAAWLAAGFTAHPETRHVTRPGSAPVQQVDALRFRPFEYRHTWYLERERLRREEMGPGLTQTPRTPESRQLGRPGGQHVIMHESSTA